MYAQYDFNMSFIRSCDVDKFLIMHVLQNMSINSEPESFLVENNTSKNIYKHIECEK